MTASQFIEAFNAGPGPRAQVFRRQNLKEPDINLLIALPEGGPGVAIVFAGYIKVNAAVWYIITKGDKRIAGKAFQMHFDPEATFKEFLKTIDHKGALPFFESLRSEFIKDFTSPVIKMCTDN